MKRPLLQELGQDPTPEQIAERWIWRLDKVREILKIAQEPCWNANRGRRYYLGDLMKMKWLKKIRADYTTRVVLLLTIDEVLDTLTDRVCWASLRFGLDEEMRAWKMESLRAPERIRQIEAKSFSPQPPPPKQKQNHCDFIEIKGLRGP